MDNKHVALVIFNTFFDISSSGSDSDSDIDTSDLYSSEDELCDNVIGTIYTVLMLGGRCGDSLYKPSIPNYVERIVPSYLIEEFKSNFRMLPSTFDFVLSQIGPAISSVSSFSGRRTIAADKQLKLALSYMATPNSYRSLCEKFKVGRATVVRTLRRVAYALHCLAPQWIRWPTSKEMVKVSQDFEAKSGFPNVVGVIAGMQVNVRIPKERACSIVDRKGDYSVHLQAVCDSHGVFTYCVAGNLGSFHDSCMGGTLPLARYFANPNGYFAGDTHLIGDAAYGIHAHLQVPFEEDVCLTAAQKNYNHCLSLGKSVVEMAFSILKGRFRNAFDTLAFSDMKKIPEFVVACSVLHNICLLKNDNLDEEECVVPLLSHIPFYNDASARLLGEEKRERIMYVLPLKLESERY